MSQFYSDMITWAAVGLFGGALFLSGAQQESATGTVGETAVLVAAETGPTAPLLAEPIADPVDIRELDLADAKPAILGETLDVITEAELETVVFTATGDQSGLSALPASNAGIVTGESVNMRSGPGTGFDIVARASRNDRLLVTGQRDGIWVEVVLPYGGDDLAWIHGNYFDAPDTASGDPDSVARD